MRINGFAVRELREAREMTALELASKVGLSNHSHISNIEAGRRDASPTLVKKIAAALKVPYVSLLGPEDPAEAIRVVEAATAGDRPRNKKAS